MDESPPGIRRVCAAINLSRPAGLAVDADFGGRVRAAVVDACVASGLQRMLLTLQGDDAQVALFPAGIDEPRAIASFTAQFGVALRRINRYQLNGGRLRVTMAVHEGIMILGSDGYRGYAITKACQLVKSEAVREAQAACGTADLIVILSERIFDDISRLDVPWLPTGICRRVEIEDPAEGNRDVGWIYVPPHLT